MISNWQIQILLFFYPSFDQSFTLKGLLFANLKHLKKASGRQLDFVSNLGLWEVEFGEQIDKLPPKRPKLANFPLKYKNLKMTFEVKYL